MTNSDEESEPRRTVAVIGAGTMGAAMARRLLDSGFDVHVWSRHAASTTPLVDLGAIAFEKAVDAVTADVVITTLPTAQATHEVMLDGQALLAMPQHSIWVQMATI